MFTFSQPLETDTSIIFFEYPQGEHYKPTLGKNQHWFRQWPGAAKQLAFTRASIVHVPKRRVTSNEQMQMN